MGCFAQVSGWTCTSFETHTWDSQRHCSPFCLVVHVVFLFTSHIISSRALHRYRPAYCIATRDGVTNLVVWALRTHRSRMEALQLQLAQRISVSPLMWCDKTPEMRRRHDATCKGIALWEHTEVNDRRDNLKPKQAINTPNFADIGGAGASGRFFSITSSTLSQQNSKQIVHCAQLATLSPSFTWRAASVWWKRYALQRRVEMCWRGIPNRFLHSLWFDAGWRRVQLTWELWFCARPQSNSRNSQNICQLQCSAGERPGPLSGEQTSFETLENSVTRCEMMRHRPGANWEDPGFGGLKPWNEAKVSRVSWTREMWLTFVQNLFETLETSRPGVALVWSFWSVRSASHLRQRKMMKAWNLWSRGTWHSRLSVNFVIVSTLELYAASCFLCQLKPFLFCFLFPGCLLLRA